MAEIQNLDNLFTTVTKYFSPKIIAEVNDVFVKIAKVKGQDVPWHTHDQEDELFYVIKGSLTMEIKGEDSFIMNEGDIYTVKSGIEHRIYTTDECWLILIENKTTKHTGDVESSITKTIKDQQYD